MKVTDDMKYKKEDTINPYNVLECVKCNGEITYDELLCKYGPEGLYRIADKLVKIADKDVREAMKDSHKWI